MGDNSIGLSLPHAFAPAAAQEFKLPKENANDPQQHDDSWPHALTRLLTQVATRRSSDRYEFDVDQVASELQERIIGTELNICSPSPGLKKCLAALQPQEMESLLRAATADGGQSSAEIELNAKRLEIVKPALMLDAESLEFVKPALMHCSDDLSSLTVRVSAGDGNPDVEGIQGANGLPVIEFIRTEETAPAACANDPELRETLIGLLEEVANRKPGFDRSHIGVVAQAIMSCASVDDEFGWDFKGKLPAAYVPWVMELGVEAFTALQDSNERAGTGTAWVDLNDEFVVNADLVERLKEFTPLKRLTVPAPVKGVFLNVGELQGGGVLLKELLVRNAHDKKLCVTVPATITWVRPEDATSVSCPQRWTLTFEIGKDYFEVPPAPVGAEALRGTLLRLFETMNPPSPRIERAMPRAAAQAILDCGSFDEHGNFGWDFTALPRPCVPWLQDLPVEGFKALQRCAMEIAHGTAWLALPDEFAINQDMVARMAALAPLRTLSMPAPSLYMDLRGLQGGRIEFHTLLIRRQTGKLRLEVPERVKEIRSEGPEGQQLLNQSRIAYCDASGKRVKQTIGPRPLIEALPLSTSV